MSQKNISLKVSAFIACVKAAKNDLDKEECRKLFRSYLDTSKLEYIAKKMPHVGIMILNKLDIEDVSFLCGSSSSLKILCYGDRYKQYWRDRIKDNYKKSNKLIQIVPEPYEIYINLYKYPNIDTKWFDYLDEDDCSAAIPLYIAAERGDYYTFIILIRELKDIIDKCEYRDNVYGRLMGAAQEHKHNIHIIETLLKYIRSNPAQMRQSLIFSTSPKIVKKLLDMGAEWKAGEDIDIISESIENNEYDKFAAMLRWVGPKGQHVQPSQINIRNAIDIAYEKRDYRFLQTLLKWRGPKGEYLKPDTDNIVYGIFQAVTYHKNCPYKNYIVRMLLRWKGPKGQHINLVNVINSTLKYEYKKRTHGTDYFNNLSEDIVNIVHNNM